MKKIILLIGFCILLTACNLSEIHQKEDGYVCSSMTGLYIESAMPNFCKDIDMQYDNKTDNCIDDFGELHLYHKIQNQTHQIIGNKIYENIYYDSCGRYRQIGNDYYEI